MGFVFISFYISLCGDAELLKMSDGRVFAVSAKTEELVALPDGDYRTTDGRQCNFTLSTANGRRSVRWDGAERASWPVN